MIKLTKIQVQEKAELLEELQKAESTLASRVEAYNEKMREEFTSVEESLGTLNSVIERVNNFMTDVGTSCQDEFDGKSEKWQEGERGQAAADFISTWSDTIDEAELEMPDELETPIGMSETFEALPEEPF